MQKFEFAETQFQQFLDDGYVVLENFLTFETCDSLRQEILQLIDKADPDENKTIFSTGEHEHSFDTGKSSYALQMKQSYFLNSGDKIRYFWEAEAADSDGNLNRPKHLAINKIGHGLHALNPEFKKATINERTELILRKLGFIRPIIPQSMYIFKQPGIGGSVMKHIDATFLESTPLKLTGLWIALEDATLENGCLWFVPKSHKNAKVTQRMVRNSDSSGAYLIFTGKLEEIEDEKYIPVPVKKGSIVLIDGLECGRVPLVALDLIRRNLKLLLTGSGTRKDGMVQHMSKKNTSDRSRHIYTFHASESYKSTWSSKNWLQPTEEVPFPVLYDDSKEQ